MNNNEEQEADIQNNAANLEKEINSLLYDFSRELLTLLDPSKHSLVGNFSFGINKYGTPEASARALLTEVNTTIKSSNGSLSSERKTTGIANNVIDFSTEETGDLRDYYCIVDNVGDGIINKLKSIDGECEDYFFTNHSRDGIYDCAVYHLELVNLLGDLDNYNWDRVYHYCEDNYGNKYIEVYKQVLEYDDDDDTAPIDRKSLCWFTISGTGELNNPVLTLDTFPSFANYVKYVSDLDIT